MTKPLVDYFIDQCGYQVIVVNRTVSKAEAVIAGRASGRAVTGPDNDPDILDEAIREVDVVISMAPKPIHIHVAKSCLRNGKSMLTTAYEIPELLALEQEATKKGILILNELGEVPGMDHFGTQMILDEIREERGHIISLHSYGSGLPAYESNNNPLGYKFAWDPRTVFVAAQTGAGTPAVVPPAEWMGRAGWPRVRALGPQPFGDGAGRTAPPRGTRGESQGLREQT